MSSSPNASTAAAATPRNMKVLIGVDGSYDGDEAFDFYARHYHAPEHEALVVYVVKPLIISSNEIAIHVNDIRDRSLNEEKMKVKFLKESYEDKMRTTGIRGKINIIYYSKKPGKIICELAEQEHCVMVVIGCIRNGKGNLGPTVDYVMRKSPCAVSLVRIGSSLPGSRTKLHELYSAGRSSTSKDSNPRLRRISCPVLVSPPRVLEEGEAVGGGGAAGWSGLVGGAGETVPPGAAAKQPKQRRHSVVTSAFQYLGFQQMGKKKLIPSHDEQDEENNDSNS